MLVNLQIEFDKSKYSEIIRKCSLLANEAEINKAINRAAKRAADTAKAESVRQLTSEYTLPASEIRETIATRNIGSDKLGAVMDISSGPFALPKFKGVTPKEVMPPAKGPVHAQIKKGGGATLKQAFIAKMKSGHVGVYERQGEKPFPIDQKFGPSTPSMFGRENDTEINKAVRKLAGETFDKRVQHELERLLNG
jgi:hypothetical protein